MILDRMDYHNKELKSFSDYLGSTLNDVLNELKKANVDIDKQDYFFTLLYNSGIYNYPSGIEIDLMKSLYILSQNSTMDSFVKVIDILLKDYTYNMIIEILEPKHINVNIVVNDLDIFNGFVNETNDNIIDNNNDNISELIELYYKNIQIQWLIENCFSAGTKLNINIESNIMKVK